MTDREKMSTLFLKHVFKDFRWINPQNIVTSYWVRMKCMFGCREYGKSACCPPNTLSVDDCKRFFSDYNEGVVFHFGKHFKKPDDRHKWSRDVNQSLLKLEREVFLSGNPKAFLLFMDSCNICENCAEERVDCKNKRFARPTPEAMAIDVFSTVRQLGYPIEVLRDYSETMNRYAFLLIE